MRGSVKRGANLRAEFAFVCIESCLFLKLSIGLKKKVFLKISIGLKKSFLILFFIFKYCVMLMWKIVVPAKTSVLYIYID